ncbi:MAG: S8 family peptidase [Candidatus Cryptobacteroides sp.]|jgi:subtilisin family serine protease
MKAHDLFMLVPLLILSGCSYFSLQYSSIDPPSEYVSDMQVVNMTDSEVYYYYFDEKVFLKEKKDLLLACFTDALSRRQYIAELPSVSSLTVWNPANSTQCEEDNSYNILILQDASGKEIQESQVKGLISRPGVRYASYILEYEGNLVSVSDEFSVKLKHRSNYQEMLSLLQEHGCILVEDKNSGDEVYCIRRNRDSIVGSVKLSSNFYETGLFDYASPRFLWFDVSTSPDPLYSSQWGLNNPGMYGYSGVDIDAEDAWEITEGDSDIVVAVIDDGVDLEHPDLESNLVEGHDVLDSNGDGSPYSVYENHGTAVAGIIGAIKDNGIGIAGVAPRCKIMSIRSSAYIEQLGKEGIYSEDARDAFDWARSHGADVINCSWGGMTPDQELTIAINNAATLGRDGKGCVIVFSSGNNYQSNDGPVVYPAYLNNVMAVGAVSYDARRVVRTSPGLQNLWSSMYGSVLDVVAPGVKIPTTDRVGAEGYGNTNYYSDFGGTSAAAPHVAGIAALILSEYPNLSQELVRKAIERGCVTLASYSFSSDGLYPEDFRNNEVGYGLVNASNALGEAAVVNVQNTLDHNPGLDFTIINSSSYSLEDVIVDVQGTIGGQTEWLISSDITGSIDAGTQAGYPCYRGYSLDAAPGTPITGITLALYASCVDCPDNLQIGVAFDTPTPTSYQNFSFGDGDPFQATLPNIIVPNSSRRRIYIRIFDVISYN